MSALDASLRALVRDEARVASNEALAIARGEILEALRDGSEAFVRQACAQLDRHRKEASEIAAFDVAPSRRPLLLAHNGDMVLVENRIKAIELATACAHHMPENMSLLDIATAIARFILDGEQTSVSEIGSVENAGRVGQSA